MAIEIDFFLLKQSPLPKSRGNVDVNNNQVYGLELKYEFEQPLTGDSNIILCQGLHNLLYDNIFEGQFYQIFNENKKLVGKGEAFNETNKLTKGNNYTILLQIRSNISTNKLLSNLQSLRIRIDTSFSKSLSCSLYKSQIGILNGNDKVTKINFDGFCNNDIYKIKNNQSYF